MEYRDLKDRIVLSTLPNIPFDGWSKKALRQGAAAEGLDRDAVERAFPGGPVEAVAHFADMANRLMEADMDDAETEGLRLHERVRLALLCRLERWSHEREAIRRGMALLSLPGNLGLSLKASYATVDSIWRAAGDTSVDFSFYTKRVELAGIYAATLLVWLDDTSDDIEITRAFLDRRLEGAMRLRKARAKVEEKIAALPNPLNLFSKRLDMAKSFRMR
ncbi:MAG: COQ9 family protein [Rhodospirillum sp.]|nr:COQ9 family protein [Rhodospirillum sp.]MCF8491947.1 COQ9 family protein [Rhodospirillum sp.]MCF8501095.1 COQ9 family protein [Rhodospirillum sp.]